MTDHFALLELPRSPWLEPAEVKAHFAKLSGPVHPDRVHQADDVTRADANRRYADLNAAQQCLIDTRLRLRHLVELESGEPPSDVGQVPQGISELFFKVGQALRVADQLLKEKEAASSPMVRAQLAQRIVEPVDQLQRLQAELQQRRGELDERCRALTRGWSAERVPAAAGLQRDYSYLDRWLGQVLEKSLQLTL
ncbi:MAG TPA: hypothetical protein DCY13_22060 [Verrucomicrobiales bacterium]|nr:hypothetical protein [Verrucomicrobiales bacterium]